MKNILIVTLLCSTLYSCVSVRQIGKLNMVANRNVDSSVEYEPLRNYAGGDKKALKRTRARSIDAAIDETVRQVPGGEYLMNAKVYLVNGQYIAVEGDVWGKKTNADFRGYKVADAVNFKDRNKLVPGKIKTLIDSETALVEFKDGKLKVIEYKDLINTSGQSNNNKNVAELRQNASVEFSYKIGQDTSLRKGTISQYNIRPGESEVYFYDEKNRKVTAVIKNEDLKAL